MHGDPDPQIATLGATTATMAPDDEEPRRFMSLARAAHVLDISEKEVTRRIDAGDMDGVWIGRRHLVVVASLDAYADRLIEQERQRRAAS